MKNERIGTGAQEIQGKSREIVTIISDFIVE